MEIETKKTIVQVKNVLFQDTGRKRAIYKFVHSGLCEKFIRFRNDFRENEFELEHYEEDLWKFVESLNLEIKNEYPQVRLENGRYVIDMSYEIHVHEKTE